LEPKELIQKSESLITNLYSLYKIRLLYPSNHPRFIESLGNVMGILDNIFMVYTEVAFVIVEEEFIFENEPLFQTVPIMREFVEVFENFHIERFAFLKGITSPEISAFISLLTTNSNDIKEEESLKYIHKKHEFSHLLLERLAKPETLSDIVNQYYNEKSVYGILPPTVRTQYRNLYENTKIIFNELSKSKRGDLTIFDKQIDQAVDDFYDYTDDFVDKFHTLKMGLGERDHDVNVCELTIAFGKNLGLERTSLKQLSLAALLHDIGKLSLPPNLQNKPVSMLSPKEMELYRQHPINGAERLLVLDNVPSLAVIVCYEHHIGFDKKGFPTTMKDRKPHFASYMVNLVERYETIVRLSPEHLKREEYIAEMLPYRGLEFEPHLFDAFASFLTE